MIYAGTDRGLTEAPHIFKRNGWYYLTTAEGGTGYDHAVTMARSRSIWGPYETHPAKHILSARDAPDSPIQRVGHGQYVMGHDGRHWHSFLMGRPLQTAEGRFCPLGRETGLEEVEWRDDWLWLKAGGMVPREEVSSDATPVPAASQEHDLTKGVLPAEFQWLRHPDPSRLFRMSDKGLTLIGRESIGSWFEQSLVARRQTDFRYEADCTLAFSPETYQQAAGLTTYYNRFKFHALLLSDEPGLGPALSVMSCAGDADGQLVPRLPPVAVGLGAIDLKVVVDHAEQRFFWRQSGGDWAQIGPVLEATLISDEAGRGEHGSFTGAFVGMVAFDISGAGREAHFTRFAYRPT